MDAWTKACVEFGGEQSQNVFRTAGKRYMWETDGKEHDDGAITGEILRFIDDTRAVITTRFRILPNGRVTYSVPFGNPAIWLSLTSAPYLERA
jgi:hypothetical protein